MAVQMPAWAGSAGLTIGSPLIPGPLNRKSAREPPPPSEWVKPIK